MYLMICSVLQVTLICMSVSSLSSYFYFYLFLIFCLITFKFFFFLFFFLIFFFFFFFQAEDGIRDVAVTGVQTCALPICRRWRLHLFKLRPRHLRPHDGLLNPQEQLGVLHLFAKFRQERPHFCKNEVRSEERRVGKECRYRRGAKH